MALESMSFTFGDSSILFRFVELGMHGRGGTAKPSKQMETLRTKSKATLQQLGFRAPDVGRFFLPTLTSGTSLTPSSIFTYCEPWPGKSSATGSVGLLAWAFTKGKRYQSTV